MQRREFLQAVSVAGGVPLAMSGFAGPPTHPTRCCGSIPPQIIRRGDMRYRKLGKTGEEVSCIGLGGHHIGRQKDEEDSIKIIRAAIDAGINFMDNCWDYHDGGERAAHGQGACRTATARRSS